MKVASRVNQPGRYGDARVTRARGYAAMALRSLTRAGPGLISRMVGAGSPHVYLAKLSQQVSRGEVRWWSDEAFERVCGAVRWQQGLAEASPPPAPENEPREPAGDPWPPPTAIFREPDPPEAYLQPRPVASPGKRDLLDELRRAVENTARMTPPSEEQP